MDVYTQAVSRILFPLHEHVKRHDTCAILRNLEKSQWLTPAQLRTYQSARLHQLLSFVRREVPYYREHCHEVIPDSENFDAFSVLANLPIIDKQTIRDHSGGWIADGASPLSQHRTSGSSGEPLVFSLSKHRISFDIAAKWRATRWWGVEIGDPELVLWGSSLENSSQDRVRALRDRLLRSRLIPARHLDSDTVDRILERIGSVRPRMLFGYPSALARIAFQARKNGRRMSDIGIRVAFCTSEVLRPEWREVISAVFGCGVANEYGARDAGFIARECPHGGMHITAEEVIVEVVNEKGEPVPPGVEGDILVTNLAGPEFPFIRYRTGDRGILSPHVCDCGRGLPLLEQVLGRTNDGLFASNGAWIHGSAVNHLLRELPGLQSYRVEQAELCKLSLQLVATPLLPQPFLNSLEGRLHSLLGKNVHIEIRHVEQIPPEANGKFRHIVCRASPPEEVRP